MDSDTEEAELTCYEESVTEDPHILTQMGISSDEFLEKAKQVKLEIEERKKAISPCNIVEWYKVVSPSTSRR